MTNRFVFDASVLISAFLFSQSIPRQALSHARETGGLYFSNAIESELEDLFQRKKFDKYISRETRLELLDGYIKMAVLHDPEITITACRDPKDDKYLELAVSAEASCIVTGDNDLLVLHPFQKIPVLSPKDFIEANF